jgi:S1-C subfamily serine protease
MNKNSALKIIILAVVFGLIAGIVGQLIAAAYLLPEETLVLVEEGKIRREVAREAEEKEKIDEAQKMVAPTVFEIYPQKQSTREPLNQIYLPSERAAFGVILTSDGWLASFGKDLADPKNKYVIITADQKIFVPQKILLDEATDAVFLKIDAQNLPVPKLGDYKNSSLGEKIILPLGKQKMKISQIENLNYQKIETAKDLIESSEKFSKTILLKDSWSGNEVGAPIINLEGEIIGLATNSSNEASPINFWEKGFLTILKNDKIVRPYFGVSYLDLAKTAGLSEIISQNKKSGTLLFSDKSSGIIGVEKNSPAAKAGLRDNDIVLKVGTNELTAKIDFTEIIQNYSPGDKLELVILRNGEEKTVEATLGEKLR